MYTRAYRQGCHRIIKCQRPEKGEGGQEGEEGGETNPIIIISHS